jgi:hypothetical protein
MANLGATPCDAVADRWVPLVSPFSFSKNFENRFPLKEKRYKVRKLLRKFVEVGNEIWNTFHH